MKTMKKAIVSMMLMFAAGVAIVGISAGPASAGVITWGAVQDVTWSVTDVSTNGVFVDSATNWSSDLMVNGVTFNHTLSSANPFTYANSSNIVVAFPAAYLSTSNPQTADYEKLLATSQYSGASGTITIGGLTSGSDYEVQVWSGNWNTTYTTKFDGILLHTGNNSGTAPQYMVGTFTADASTQVISIGTGNEGFSFMPAAVQVRSLQDSLPVPEPAGLGLVGLALLALKKRRS